MRRCSSPLPLVLIAVMTMGTFLSHAQVSTRYEISFENAVHHQGNVKATSPIFRRRYWKFA